MGISRGENTTLITRFHYNHLFSIIQTKLIQAKFLSQKSAQKILAHTECLSVNLYLLKVNIHYNTHDG